jgi:hypothetical protein
MRRILVVDDDLHVGQAIGVWLKAPGFRVASPMRAHRALDRDFGLRLFRNRKHRIGIPPASDAARRHALLAQGRLS